MKLNKDNSTKLSNQIGAKEKPSAYAGGFFLFICFFKMYLTYAEADISLSAAAFFIWSRKSFETLTTNLSECVLFNGFFKISLSHFCKFDKIKYFF